MIKALLLPALICLAGACYGQRITFVKTFGGMGFQMDTVTLSMGQVQEIMRINPVAHDEFKKARSYYSASGLLGFTGAILIAIPLVSAVAGSKDPEWGLAAVGGAFILVSIPLNRTFQNHAFNALDEYNRPYESRRIKKSLQLTGTGARLILRF